MEVSELNIYPIKSLKGISVQDSDVEAEGFSHDRRRMIVDPDGTFITQRELPVMATVQVEFRGEGLLLSKDGSSIAVPMAAGTGTFRDVVVWNSTVEAEVYDDDVNRWISDAIGKSCSLVSMPVTSKRVIEEDFNSGDDIVGFADDFPFLIANEASLAELNSRMDEALPMNRFRPNIVVSGADAFAEDNWQRIKIGETVMRAAKPSARCPITTVDQSVGEFAGKEPLATLATFRRAKHVFPTIWADLGMKENYALFAQHFVPENVGGLIKVGDEIEILQLRPAL